MIRTMHTRTIAIPAPGSPVTDPATGSAHEARRAQSSSVRSGAASRRGSWQLAVAGIRLDLFFGLLHTGACAWYSEAGAGTKGAVFTVLAAMLAVVIKRSGMG